MNIVKRLLNVVMAYGVFLCGVAVYEWGNVALEYKVALENKTSACDRWNAEIANHKKSEWREFELVSSPDKELCDQTPSHEIFAVGREEIAIGLGVLVFVAALNYILFGKVSIWNRSESSPKEH